MTCQRWSPDKLLPIADRILGILAHSPHVSGVALTGSLARLEPWCHDIDIVVLHDGAFPDDQSLAFPAQWHGYEGKCLGDAALSNDFLTTRVLRELDGARREVPLNCIFVGEEVLWSCEKLQELDRREKEFPGFFLSTFCQQPLVLLEPYQCAEGIRQYIEGMPVVPFSPLYAGNGYPSVAIRHRCGNSGCRPKLDWPARRRELVKRKGHIWHD